MNGSNEQSTLKTLFTVLLTVLALFALAAAGCESGPAEQTEDTEEMSATEQCRDQLTDPTCEQCCLKAGATEHDFDPVDDGDPRCSCFSPTR